MSQTRTDFVFRGSESNDQIKVTIPEVADESYGLYIWPCSPVLAQYVWQRRDFLQGKNVLELGAGTALPGIVAAKCGACVTLSDNAENKKCLRQCWQSAKDNALQNVAVVGITWGCVSPEMNGLNPLDIILASDCFYDSKDFEDVLMTMAYLLEINPDAEVWCSYQVRSSERSIQQLLLKWDLYAEILEYPNMDMVESKFNRYKTCVIELFVIKKKPI